MANMPDIEKKRVSLLLRVETVAKMDKRAEMDNTSRNAVAEYYLSAALERLVLSPAEIEKVKEEIRANAERRRGE